MKNIKRHCFNLLVLLFLSSFTFLSCDKDEPPFLRVKEDQQNVNFSTAAATTNVTIETNVNKWIATVEPTAKSWIETRQQGRSLRITVTENPDKDSRTGVITISGGGLTATINVQQLGQAAAILVSSDIFSISADGGDVHLQITSNVDYDIIIPDAAKEWFKPVIDEKKKAPSAMVTKDFYYVVFWNPDVARDANIVIKQRDGETTATVLVMQKGQDGYVGASEIDIKDDIKVPVSSASASSYQNGSGNIEFSYDGDMNTMYHSSWNNTGKNYFPITLDYHFQNQESIDYLVYYPRLSGPNGLFKEVEIWTATEAEPTLKKQLEFDFKGSASATKITFKTPLLKPKTIRFVVKSGAGDGQGFASCAEMEFYRKNTDNYDPLNLFTDITCSELKPGITMTDIQNVPSALYRNIALYMLKGTYPSEFRIQSYEPYPHPDAGARENKTKGMNLLDNPTGISVSQGDDLVVFVGNTNGNTLSIKVQNLYKPGADGYANASYYPLSEGVNKLKMKSSGLIYLFYHTPKYKTESAIKIHFATGKVNGYFDAEKHSRSDWNRLLNAAVDQYFDLLSEHAHITFPAADLKKYAATTGPELIEAYSDLVRLQKEFMGLMKYNRPSKNRGYFHATYTNYMYATQYRTAYNVSSEDVKNAVMNVNQLKKSPWGPAHEMGHVLQTVPGFMWIGMTEVTNNVHSLYVQTEWGNPSRIESEPMGRYNNRYEKAFHSSFVHGTAHPAEKDVFCKLVSLWQLQLYFANAKGQKDLYKDLYEKVRSNPDKPTDGERQLEFVKMMCDITQTNLTDFFKKWGYLMPIDIEIDDYVKRQMKITQAQVDAVIAEIKAKNYPVIKDKIEYIADSNWMIFRDKLSIQQGAATKGGKNIKMTGWKNVVAYEVFEGDKLVFVSNKDSFDLDEQASANTKVFAVAYDGTKKEVIF